MNYGQSTVDLAFVSEAFFDNIRKFMVFPLSELTDHCKIALEIPYVIIDTCKSRPYKWINLKPIYKWDKNSASKFKKAFDTTKVKSEIGEFCSSGESNNADIVSQKLYNIFIQYAKTPLKRSNLLNRKNTKKNDKLWYDKGCDQKRNEMKNISKDKSSDPLNRELKERFKEKMKQSKLMCQQKRQIFWSDKMNQLGETTHPKMIIHFGVTGNNSQKIELGITLKSRMVTNGKTIIKTFT